MDFRAEHRIPGPVEDVMATLGSPVFQLALRLPDLAPPELLEHHDDGNAIVLVLRYEFVGNLDPIARRLLGGRQLTWRQELHLDRAARNGRLDFASEADPRRLHGDASFTFTAENGETIRRIEGKLVIDAPFVNRIAEPRVVQGVLRRLDIEAQAVGESLQS
jgi:hypothetical protein